MGNPTEHAERGESLGEHGPWVEVGEVSRVHGLLGRLLVSLYGDDPENLIHAGRLQLRGPPGTIEFRLEEAVPAGTHRRGRALVRIRLAGLVTREKATPWTGASLSIPEAALRSLPSGEYYWRDLLGLRCRTVSGRDLGQVEEIWPAGGHDLLVVRKGSETVLIPTLRSVLVKVDRSCGEVRIDPPSGLLEGPA